MRAAERENGNTKGDKRHHQLAALLEPSQPHRPLPIASSLSPAPRVPIAHSPSPLARASHAQAFTLLELLMVMSLIAVLASIVLVVGRGISERSKVSQAKAEMAVLAAALEQYKQQYGDYPWTPDPNTLGPGGAYLDGGAILFNALCGNLGPKAESALSAKGRTFVDLARFTLDRNAEDDLPLEDDTVLRINWFNDPWNGWYYYHYKKSGSDAAWRSKGFLLYSHGPDSECDVGPAEDSGFFEDVPSTPQNVDNIYHGRS